MFAELLENIISIISMFPPVVVIPAILIILIIKNPETKADLKNSVLLDFLFLQHCPYFQKQSCILTL